MLVQSNLGLQITWSTNVFPRRKEIINLINDRDFAKYELITIKQETNKVLVCTLEINKCSLVV